MYNKGKWKTCLLTPLHALFVALGIGTAWSANGLVGSVDDGCPYEGVKANAEFNSISGCDALVLDGVDNSDPDNPRCSNHLSG